MIELLKSHRVLICAGTGGVGKTTLSASLGVLAAREGLRTLVLTIDPARRLAQALGLKATGGGEDVAVPGQERLFAAMINPREEFDQFVLGTVDNVIAKGLFNNKLYQQLASNLNGSQEFTSLVRLLRATENNAYDLIILDTPPTQNAVDFLRAPERLYALFQDSVIGWFANPVRDEGWLKRTLHRGTRLVTSGLEAATGSGFINELKDFFNHIGHLKTKIAAVSGGVHELLHAPTTGFILVTGFDETELTEALEFQGDLDAERLKLLGVFVNRWIPEWSTSEAPASAEIATVYRQFQEYFRQRQDAFAQFVTRVGRSVPVLKLPDFRETVRGLEDLNQMATTVAERWSSR